MNRNEDNRALWSSNNTTKVKYRPTKTSRIHTKRTKTHIFSTLQAEKCFLHLLVQKQVLFFVFIMIYILSYFFKYWCMLLNSALDSTFLKNLLLHFLTSRIHCFYIFIYSNHCNWSFVYEWHFRKKVSSKLYVFTINSLKSSHAFGSHLTLASKRYLKLQINHLNCKYLSRETFSFFSKTCFTQSVVLNKKYTLHLFL